MGTRAQNRCLAYSEQRTANSEQPITAPTSYFQFCAAVPRGPRRHAQGLSRPLAARGALARHSPPTAADPTWPLRCSTSPAAVPSIVRSKPTSCCPAAAVCAGASSRILHADADLRGRSIARSLSTGPSVESSLTPPRYATACRPPEAPT